MRGIQPVLTRQCVARHQPQSRQADLLLNAYSGLRQGGRNGPVFTASARLARNLRESVASSVGNPRILQGEKGKSPDQVTMLVNTNFATPATLFGFNAAGAFEVDGATAGIVSPAVTFEIAYGYQLSGDVYREPTFEGGPVRIEAQAPGGGGVRGFARISPAVFGRRISPARQTSDSPGVAGSRHG